jgi:hypothetical protein
MKHHEEFFGRSCMWFAGALTAYHAVEFCNEMGFTDVILEDDVLQIVNAVATIAANLDVHIVDGIKSRPN